MKRAPKGGPAMTHVAIIVTLGAFANVRCVTTALCKRDG
jgi:hypothetical protein